MNELEQLKQRIEELERMVQALSNPAELDAFTVKAFENRLFKISSKSATSEQQTVNEGGMDSYGVLPLPDGYIQLSNSKYIPYFN